VAFEWQGVLGEEPLDRVLIAIAAVVTLVWATVVVVAFTHRGPDGAVDGQLVSLATIVTPVMLALVGGLVAIVTRRVNGRHKPPNGNGS
jgi:hypothetical protein